MIHRVIFSEARVLLKTKLSCHSMILKSWIWTTDTENEILSSHSINPYSFCLSAGFLGKFSLNKIQSHKTRKNFKALPCPSCQQRVHFRGHCAVKLVSPLVLISIGLNTFNITSFTHLVNQLELFISYKLYEMKLVRYSACHTVCFIFYATYSM